MGTGGVLPPPNSEPELPHCEGQTFLTWKMVCVSVCVHVCLCLCVCVCTVGAQLLTLILWPPADPQEGILLGAHCAGQAPAQWAPSSMASVRLLSRRMLWSKKGRHLPG